MYMKDVVRKCHEKGYKVSRNYIYAAGLKYGFLKRVPGQRGLELDQKKFLEWVDKALEEAPEGWVTLKELVKMKGISMNMAYEIVKDKAAGARRIGSGQGIIYVDPKTIDVAIKKYKNRHSYEWEDE